MPASQSRPSSGLLRSATERCSTNMWRKALTLEYGDYTAYKLTSEGLDWLSANNDKLTLRKGDPPKLMGIMVSAGLAP